MLVAVTQAQFFVVQSLYLELTQSGAEYCYSLKSEQKLSTCL